MSDKPEWYEDLDVFTSVRGNYDKHDKECSSLQWMHVYRNGDSTDSISWTECSDCTIAFDNEGLIFQEDWNCLPERFRVDNGDSPHALCGCCAARRGIVVGEIEQVRVVNGNSIEVLHNLPDASIHAVVTDPPYGLSATDPAHVSETLSKWLAGDRTFLPSGRGFMGHEWDSFVPPPAIWDECLRVLKPGGYLLAFAGSRTMDLMSLSIRLAGFDMRDSIAWIHGQGFPKSLNISKSIDKMNGRDLPTRYALAQHIREQRELAGFTRADVAGWFPQYSEVTANWERLDPGNRVPTLEDWDVLRSKLNVSDVWLPLIERVEAEREITGVRSGYVGSGFGNVGHGLRGEDDAVTDTIPATPDAHTWNGWGTSLKPALEPIVVARKPLDGTVTQNILDHGVGGMNIDACRISTDKSVTINTLVQWSGFGQEKRPQYISRQSNEGRWPTNVVLTHADGCTSNKDDSVSKDLSTWQCVKGCPVAELNTYSGSLTNGETASKGNSDNSLRQPDEKLDSHNNSEGISRFFPVFRYQAKATKKERPVVDGISHSTVKPLDLMRWLVRLVTPPGGIVLDPFAGSGTTGEAALLEGFAALLIERETDYIPLIIERLSRSSKSET